MKAFYAVMVLTLLAGMAGTAYAQTPSINMLRDEHVRTPEEREKDKIINDAYKEEMKKIPDQKASADPWGTVRSADAPKSASKGTLKGTSATHKQNPK